MSQQKAFAAKLVDAAYRGLLGRDPDLEGRAAWIQKLMQTNMDIERFLNEFIRAKEFYSRLNSSATERKSWPLINEKSQYGEVGLFIHRLMDAACTHKIVVDVGARGIERSNSFDLMKHFGWRGLLVEAHPDLCKNLSVDLQGLDATIINCAVSDFEGHSELFLGANLDISSLNESATASWGKVNGSIIVPVRRLSDILHAHEVPADFDLLSIDVEGEDLKVFNEVWQEDFKPRRVIIEASYGKTVTSLDQLDLLPEIKSAYVIFASTEANLLLERSPFPLP